MADNNPERRLRYVLLAILFVSVGIASPLLGESVLNFPRLSFESNRITGIAIVNPADNDAAVTLTAYGTDGSQLAGIDNPVSINIESEKQYSKLTSELFGEDLDPETVGWFQATSPIDDLTGFFLYLDPSITLLDGADLPRSARTVVFNQIRVDSGFSTELNLFNPGTEETEMELQLISPDSDPLGQTFTLPAKGVVRLDVATVFGTQQLAEGTYVLVTSDLEVAGFQFVQSPDGELLGMNARSSSEQLTHLYFPQVAVLGDWQTQLGVLNYSTEAVILTISVFKPEGDLYDAADLENNPVTRSLNPGQSLLEDVASMFGFQGEETLNGWMEVQSTSAAINGYICYGEPGKGSMAAVPSADRGQTTAIFSHIATVDGFFTGLAILNSGAVATDLRILALKPDGSILGSLDTFLQPGQRISQLIDELIPQAGGQPGGLIWVDSRLPVYLTSLFGTGSVLANIPAQPSPESYLPDSELESLGLTPPLAIVEPSGSQTFQVQSGEEIEWKVDGITGGGEFVGTISQTGFYTAPQIVPSPPVVTVSAESAGQASGASVDVLEKENLIQQLGLVVSVAYLGILEKLFTAELTILGTLENESVRPSAQTPSQGTESEIFEVAPGVGKLEVATFADEEISKMIPYTASNGQEFLLLAGKTGGRVIRLDPITQQSTDVATGLDGPNSLVLDPVSGNLLVAEENQITSIPKTQIESGLVLALSINGSGSTDQAEPLFPTSGADGITVDGCTGDVYFWDPEARVIRRYVRRTDVAEDLAVDLRPGQLLGFYRRGIACPKAFRLLVAGRGAAVLWLVNPVDRSARRWLTTPGPTDVTFLPKGNPLSPTEGVLLSELTDGEMGRVAFIGTPDLYADRPTNPPEKDACLGSLIFADPNLGAALRSMLALDEGVPLTCMLAQQLGQVVAEQSQIRSLLGIGAFRNLRRLLLSDNSIRNILPLAASTALQELDLSTNDIQDVRPLANLTSLLSLKLGGNRISSIEALARLSRLRILSLANNDVSQIIPLVPLRNLNTLELRGNAINSIKPLLANPGLGEGDIIDVRDNPLDVEACPDIQKLLDRGAQVVHDVSCAVN